MYNKFPMTNSYVFWLTNRMKVLKFNDREIVSTAKRDIGAQTILHNFCQNVPKFVPKFVLNFQILLQSSQNWFVKPRGKTEALFTVYWIRSSQHLLWPLRSNG